MSKFNKGDKVKRKLSMWEGITYPPISLADFDEFTVSYFNSSVPYPAVCFEESGDYQWDSAYFELGEKKDNIPHKVDVSITPQDVEGKQQSALDKQVSGDHYKDCGIQPIEYIHANGLSYLEGNVIKYTTRHSKKNGKQDILKAIHYLELILEMEYKDESI